MAVVLCAVVLCGSVCAEAVVLFGSVCAVLCADAVMQRNRAAMREKNLDMN